MKTLAMCQKNLLSQFRVDCMACSAANDRVHAMAREGFYQENAEAELFPARMHLDLDVLQAAIFEAQETSYDEAVDKLIDENEDLMHLRVTGNID